MTITRSDRPSSQGLTLAVVLWDCEPLRVRLTERGCAAYKAGSRHAECAGCKGVRELARRKRLKASEIEVAARERPVPTKRSAALRAARGRISRNIGKPPVPGALEAAAEAEAERSLEPAEISAPPMHRKPEVACPKGCGRVFTWPAALANHRKKCSGRPAPAPVAELDPEADPAPTSFACTCGRVFSRAHGLRRHRRFCNGEPREPKPKQTTCTCGRVFSRPQGLGRHRPFCDGEPYVEGAAKTPPAERRCAKCGRVCPRHLARHEAACGRPKPSRQSKTPAPPKGWKTAYELAAEWGVSPRAAWERIGRRSKGVRGFAGGRIRTYFDPAKIYARPPGAKTMLIGLEELEEWSPPIARVVAAAAEAGELEPRRCGRYPVRDVFVFLGMRELAR